MCVGVSDGQEEGALLKPHESTGFGIKWFGIGIARGKRAKTY